MSADRTMTIELLADTTEFVAALKHAAESTRRATKRFRRFTHDFTNQDILTEIRYLRLVARAEQAEAELHLERRMAAMYAELGLVRS